MCINDSFPHVKQHGGVEDLELIKPKIGDKVYIDEMLGDYLRFDAFDTEKSTNWWHYSRFKLVSNI